MRERAAELLDFVQLTDKRTAKVDDLSGGMKLADYKKWYANKVAEVGAAEKSAAATQKAITAEQTEGEGG